MKTVIKIFCLQPSILLLLLLFSIVNILTAEDRDGTAQLQEVKAALKALNVTVPDDCNGDPETGDVYPPKTKLSDATGNWEYYIGLTVTWTLPPQGTFTVGGAQSIAVGSYCPTGGCNTGDCAGNMHSDQTVVAPQWISLDPCDPSVRIMVDCGSAGRQGAKVKVTNVTGTGVRRRGSATPDKSKENPCSNCGTSSPQLQNHSVDIRIPFGTASVLTSEKPAVGEFWIYQPSPTSLLFNPGGLAYRRPDLGTKIIYNQSNLSWIRQVKSVDGLADIIATNSTQYAINLYCVTNVGIFTNGIYLTTNQPSISYVFQNAEPSNTNACHLYVIKTEGGASVTNDFNWISTNTAWCLTYPNGLSQHGIQVFSSSTMQTNLHTVCDTNTGLVALTHTCIVSNAAWGNIISSLTYGQSSNQLATIFSYYGSTNDNGYGQFNSISNSGGAWSYYTYDSLGRLKEQYAVFQNQGFTTSSNLCEYSWYDYTALSGSGDPGTQTNLPRTRIDYLLGHEIGRSYWVYLTNGTQEIQCVSAGAAWNDTNNLVTTTLYYTSGSFSNWLQSVFQADGTGKIYQYGTNSTTRTNLIWSGQLSTNRSAVVDGTETVTILGVAGQLLNRTTYDILSGVTIGQEAYSNLDQWNRPGRVDHLDGTAEYFSYDCCGISSRTDKDGVTTSYAYDALRRRVAATANGITETNSLDSYGNVLITQRFGRDGTAMTLASNGYDQGHRLIAATNALGGVTTYTYTTNNNGQIAINAIYPDGGTSNIVQYADGQLASSGGTAVRNPLSYVYGVEQFGGIWRKYRQEIKLDSNGNSTTEWKKTYVDMVGRTCATVYSDGASETLNYNVIGQLARLVDADGVSTLYHYNGQGRRDVVATDVDLDGQIANFNGGPAGSDRVKQTVTSYMASGASGNARGYDILRSTVFQWATGNSTNTVISSVSDQSADGLRSWSVLYRDQSTPVTQNSVTIFGTNGIRTSTVTKADGSQVLTTYTNGIVSSVKTMDSIGVQISLRTYDYDAHGRRSQEIDARNGTTSFTYNNSDMPTSVTTPVPGGGNLAQTTSTWYDAMGRIVIVTQPDGNSVTNVWNLTGLLRQAAGTRIYPTGYGYDAQGRITSMTNWSGFAGGSGARVTTWAYDTNRGWLSAKRYPDGVGPSYTYTSGGRLFTRTWARTSGGVAIVTTNLYGFSDGVSGNQYEDIVAINYNEGTPSIAFAYDRRGRGVGITRNGITTTRNFNDADQLVSETYTNGTLSGLNVSVAYDAYLRKSVISSGNGSSVLYVSTNSYDQVSRLQKVDDGVFSATYSYQPNSDLINTVLYQDNGTNRLLTAAGFDRLDRLQSVVSAPSGGNQPPLGYVYGYNDANQRTRLELGDSSYWIFSYDTLGQVIGGVRFYLDGTPVPGQQFGYVFDDIGNRLSTTAGGDQSGANLRSATYLANSVNEYTNRTVPATIDIIGLADPAAGVTVNGVAADYRRGEYFDKRLGVTNSSSPVWQNLSVSAGGTAVTGSVYVPPASENFTYDLDGNLTSDGRWTYSWDAENRLIRMVANISSGPQRLDFEYDAQGRRIRKTVWPNTAGTNTPTTDIKFLYDGWSLIAELNAQSTNTIIRTYQWGDGIQGSAQQSGGAGALVSAKPSGGAAQFPCFDGNGNIVGLVDGASGSFVASYEYGPFGECIRQSGSAAVSNPFRFSTQYTDSESGNEYYGYRFYSPGVGRWINRDPLGEPGGANLFAICNNNSISMIDALGLAGDPINLNNITLNVTTSMAGSTIWDNGVWSDSNCTLTPVTFELDLEWNLEVSAEPLKMGVKGGGKGSKKVVPRYFPWLGYRLSGSLPATK